jgi:hypothetical protein
MPASAPKKRFADKIGFEQKLWLTAEKLRINIGILRKDSAFRPVGAQDSLFVVKRACDD